MGSNGRWWRDLRAAVLMALWFMFLTFPLLGVRVEPVARTVVWRWSAMLWLGLTVFSLAWAWRLWQGRSRPARHAGASGLSLQLEERWREMLRRPGIRRPLLAGIVLLAGMFPLLVSSYQTSIMTTALVYVVLGLGLNIVVGLAGLLDLGYVAFYAVGAYTYALLNHHFGLGFWAVLPLGAGIAALFGLALGFPVLRLRGDYLAIVTLGFGEIIRLVLENWSEFSQGPSGIADIARPGLFGLALGMDAAIVYLYYVALGLTLCAVLVVGRLRRSRLGRAWVALREDEIACQAMGVDVTRTKLAAFSLGASWAGMAGVVFAARTTFVNPASFTFLESAIVLCIVVLGGMGSVAGVVAAALVLVLLPEYLRAFAEYRMLIFGAVLVLMMIFRPQGLAGRSGAGVGGRLRQVLPSEPA
ncbi:MAG: branched-chain amino acid ABC transporter permease [Desulfobulbaceae bacterium A2]|nr:MAG: branched-chain amino acid ABC transporter permease [Desulfobulbaceae bacterium A2]